MSYKSISLVLAIFFTTSIYGSAIESKSITSKAITNKAITNTPCSAKSLSADYAHIYLTAQAAHDRGDYVSAEKLYKAAIGLAEKFSVKDRRLAITLEDLASCYKAEGNFAAEGPIRKRIISIYLKQFGDDYPRVAQAWLNAALSYRAQGKILQAQLLYAEALNCYENCFGAKDIRVAEILGDLAQLYFIQGNFLKAEHLYKRALAIAAPNPVYEKLHAMLQDELADTLERQGKIAEAQKLLCSAS